MIWTVEKRGPGRFAVLDPNGRVENEYALKRDAERLAEHRNGGPAAALRAAAAALERALAEAPAVETQTGAEGWERAVAQRKARADALRAAVERCGGALGESWPGGPPRLRLLSVSVSCTSGLEGAIRTWIARALAAADRADAA